MSIMWHVALAKFLSARSSFVSVLKLFCMSCHAFRLQPRMKGLVFGFL